MLAARMREIVALHDAGRAISSVIDLDPVARKIVDAVARPFDVQLVALWLVDDKRAQAGGEGEPVLQLLAARARRLDVTAALATDEALTAAGALQALAERVRETRAPLRLGARGRRSDLRAAAAAARTPGPLVRCRSSARGAWSARSRWPGPRTRARIVRRGPEPPDDVRGSGGRRRRERAPLLAGARGERRAREEGAAADAARTWRPTRSSAGRSPICARPRRQLCSPSGWPAWACSSRGSPTRSTRPPRRSAARSTASARSCRGWSGAAPIGGPRAVGGGRGGDQRVPRRAAPPARRAAAGHEPDGLGARARGGRRPRADRLRRPRAARRRSGGSGRDLRRRRAGSRRPRPLAGYGADAVAALTDLVYLHRTDSTVRRAVQQIQRIVGALKTYSHLDQQATRIEADVHEGIETDPGAPRSRAA